MGIVHNFPNGDREYPDLELRQLPPEIERILRDPTKKVRVGLTYGSSQKSSGFNINFKKNLGMSSDIKGDTNHTLLRNEAMAMKNDDFSSTLFEEIKADLREREERSRREISEREERFMKQMENSLKEAKERELRFMSQIEKQESQFNDTIKEVKKDLKESVGELKAELSSNVTNMESIKTQNFWGMIVLVGTFFIGIAGMIITLFVSN